MTKFLEIFFHILVLLNQFPFHKFSKFGLSRFLGCWVFGTLRYCRCFSPLSITFHRGKNFFFCAFNLTFVFLLIIFMTVYIRVEKITPIQHRPTESPNGNCPFLTVPSPPSCTTPQVAARLSLLSVSICRPYTSITCVLGSYTHNYILFKKVFLSKLCIQPGA